LEALGGQGHSLGEQSLTRLEVVVGEALVDLRPFGDFAGGEAGGAASTQQFHGRHRLGGLGHRCVALGLRHVSGAGALDHPVFETDEPQHGGEGPARPT